MKRSLHEGEDDHEGKSKNIRTGKSRSASGDSGDEEEEKQPKKKFDLLEHEDEYFEWLKVTEFPRIPQD